tara:strand:- start:9 stop:335 length:327 start_codon:yes stop_codon:yes gene_type:complete
MSYKLQLEVENEDVRVLVTNIFNLGLNRFSRNYQNTITGLTESFSSGSSVDILESLELVVESLSSQIYELENLASIISEIDNAESAIEEDDEDEEQSIRNSEKSKKKK